MHSKKQFFLTLVISIAAILCLALVFIFLENGLRNKTSYSHMNRLLTSQNNVDVLIVGDSQASNDFLPMELWSEYGMTSYVVHANNNDIKRYKSMTELACDYCSPKLIVLSSDQYWVESSDEKILASYHEYADTFPLTVTKAKTTLERFPDIKTASEILFPFLTYHNRWKDLSDSDFVLEDTTLKGSDYIPTAASVLLPEVTGPILPSVPEEGSENLDAICDFISYFEAKGIPVMVVTFPFEVSADSEKLSYFKTLEETVTAQNTLYCNFAVDHKMVDADTDFQDGVHLNALGAKKMTSYLGKLFQDVYKIPSHFGEESFEAEWNADYSDYLNTKIENFTMADSLESALLLGNDSAFNTTVYLDWESPAWQSNKVLKLTQAITTFSQMQEARDMQCSFLGAANTGHNVIGEVLDPDDDTWIAALGGEEVVSDKDADAFVAIFDAKTGAHISTKCFHTSTMLSSEEKSAEE